MAEILRYGNVWIECAKNRRIAERFCLGNYDGFLPFFLWGDELAAFERHEKIDFREEQLLKGILVGLYEFDVNPKLWDRKGDRVALIHLIETLGTDFDFETPEQMILEVAFDMRQKGWSDASRIVLEIGAELIPESSEIKSDLIGDLWAMVAEFGEDESLLEEILSLLKKIDLDEISPDEREVVCYYGLCSLVFLGKKDDVSAFLRDYIYPNVSMSKLKLNITALLENPSAYSPADLRV